MQFFAHCFRCPFLVNRNRPIPKASHSGTQLSNIDDFRSSKQIVSLFPGIDVSTIDCSKIEKLHELKSLDLVVLPGKFGVAENGTVRVSGSALGRNRMVFIIAQHLTLVVRTG